MAEKKSTKSSDKKPEVKKAEKPEETKKTEEKPKKNKGLLWGIIGGVLAVALIAAFFFLFRGGPAPDDPKAKLSYSNSFFISDNGKYTLWNSVGKRVVEEEFDYASTILAGYAYVKKGDQYAIIRDDGTITVPFGKFGTIETKGGLFLAQDGNTKEYSVLTGSGRELMRGADLELASASSLSAFALVESETEYALYTYAGERLGVFPKVEDAADPKLGSASDFGSVFYNGQNLFFDVRTSRVLLAFEGDRYTFDSITDDREKILLENDEDDEKHKLLAGGKVYDLDETHYYAFTALGDLIGYDDYDSIAILDENYKVAKRTSAYVALKDVNNYAAINEETGNVEIIYHGGVVKTFEDSADLESGILYEDLYAITNSGKTMFYHLDGSVAFNHEYESVWSLFNKHHQAIVSDAEDEYYLIDARGNRLTDDTFKRVYTEEGGYEVKNADDKYAILGLDGKLVTDFVYESLYYRDSAVDQNIWTGRNGYNDYDVIDVANKKVLLKNVNVNSFNANYFTIKNSDGKYEYYTYFGELFYTSES